MKSRTKPALRVVPAAQVQISLPVQGVLQDVRACLLRAVHPRRQAGAGGDDGSRPRGAVRRQGRARCRAPRGAWRQHAQPRRAGRPAHRASSGRGRAALDARRAGAADLRLGRRRRPAERGDDGSDRRGRVHAPLRRHAGRAAAAAKRRSATSKSAVSRRFVALSQQQLRRVAVAARSTSWICRW